MSKVFLKDELLDVEEKSVGGTSQDTLFKGLYITTGKSQTLQTYAKYMNLLDGEVSYDIPYLSLTNELASDLFDNTLEFVLSEKGQKIEKISLQIQEGISGTLQIIGGATEAALGGATVTAVSWTGIGIPIGVLGGYVAIDGASNFTGGISRVVNAFNGSFEGDTWNLVKKVYIGIGGDTGESVYQATQIVIGVLSLGKGLVGLSDDAWKVIPRPKNIAKAGAFNMKTETLVLDLGDQVVVVTRAATELTTTPMILNKIVINKEALSVGTLFIGVDATNTKRAMKGVIGNE